MEGSRRPIVAAAVIAAILLLSSAPAFAHGDGESDKAGDLVRQAIAHLVHDPKNTMAAAEKVDDALNAADKEGVDITLVAQAADALKQDDSHLARNLLERSIGARPHLGGSDPLPIRQVPALATGAETGIDVVTDPLALHGGQTGGDWATLAGMVAVGALGVYLSVRFRPRANEAA